MRTEIAGQKITLRRLQKSFTQLAYEAAHESRGGEFARWMPWCHSDYEFRETEAFVTYCDEAWTKRSEFNFAIFLNETGAFAGLVSLNQFNFQHNLVNLGYWVRTSLHGRGIAPAAARMLAKAAFEDLEINRIEILVGIENTASRRAADKAGAVFEAILRDRLMIGTRVHDAAVYSFIAEDFA